MTLPDSPFIPLAGSSKRDKTAFLVKFPQDVWERIMAAGGVGLQIAKEDSKLNLCWNDDTIGMDLLPLGAPTEIHELGNTLNPMGIATNRLFIPFSVSDAGRTNGRTQAPNGPVSNTAGSRANGGPAAKLRQEAAPLARSHSSPAGTVNTKANTATVPTIPLKTRVVQHLALGPASVEQIVSMVGGVEVDVMRVVKVVGRQVGENPPQYSLQPSQYAKIKIADWRYTPEEQAKVGQMAREAFDELEFPANAQERTELERKLQEAASGSSRLPEPAAIQPVSAPPIGVADVPAKSTPTNKSASDTASDHASDSQQSSSQTRPAKAKPTVKGKGVVAREMAKFRAEQVRASSAPGLKSANGQASPRLSAQTISAATPEKAKKVEKGSKQEKSDVIAKSSTAVDNNTKAGANRTKPGKRKQRHPSPSFTSSEEEEEEEEDEARGRAKRRPENIKPSDKRNSNPPHANKSEQPPPSVPLPSAKRKPPPTPLNLTREPSSTTAASADEADGPGDPEELRDRYEELYPAYQLLTTKLVDLLRVAEGLEEGDMEAGAIPGEADLKKMVKKWNKWHKELTDISRWFGTG